MSVGRVIRTSIYHVFQIRRIDRKSFGASQGVLKSHWRWKHFLRALIKPYLTRVYEDDGGVRGVLVLRFEEMKAVIVYLTVLPTDRGRGIGAALMDDAIQQAAQRGCQCMQLEVSSEDEEAIAFYERHGFIKRQRLLGFYRHTHGCRTDGWLMQRNML